MQMNRVGKALRVRVLHNIQVLDDLQSKNQEENGDGVRRRQHPEVAESERISEANIMHWQMLVGILPDRD